MSTFGSSPGTYLHLKPRYTRRQVCALFGVPSHTLSDWLKRGMPLPDGSRIEFRHYRLSVRITIFHQEDVDRLYEWHTGNPVSSALVRPLPIIIDLDDCDDQCDCPRASGGARVLHWPTSDSR